MRKHTLKHTAANTINKEHTFLMLESAYVWGKNTKLINWIYISAQFTVLTGVVVFLQK